MKKAYEKFNNMTDKAFSRLVITSGLAILCCIICICSATWAWFTASVNSESNNIKTSAECLVELEVEKDGESLAVVDIENEAELQLEEGVYTLTLTLPGNSASGYALITIGEDKYYTDYIKSHDEDEKTLTLYINVGETEEPISATITARWGIYSGESSFVDGELFID